MKRALHFVAPVAAAAVLALGLAPAFAQSAGGQVKVQTLTAPDPEGFGLLQPPEGFAPDLWQDTPRPLVENLLPRIPAAGTSRALTDLGRRLVLSMQKPPAGPATKSFLALRAERAAALGQVPAAAAILRSAATPQTDPALRRIRADGAFLSGDTPGACAEVEGALRQSTDAYWQKAAAFCDVADGKAASASLSLDVLREQGLSTDRAFFILMDSLAGKPGTVESLPDPTPLHLAMIRALRQTIPPDAARTKNPTMLRAIAESAQAETLTRIEAGEQAEALGVLPTATLVSLYESVTFRPEEFANATVTAGAVYGPRSRAMLYQAAKAKPDPKTRAGELSTALSLSRKGGMFGTTARTMLPLLREVPAGPETASLASDAARAFLSEGDLSGARPWLALLKSSSTSGDAGLWALARLAGATEADGATKERVKAAASGQTARALRLNALFDAFDRPVEHDLWTAQLNDNASLPATVGEVVAWQALARDGGSLRTGETALLALVVLAKPQPPHPLSLGIAVRALKASGMEADARRVAVEQALKDGF
ncbi:MAG: hypothetical protein AB7M05_15060 [Alphaproteobacteria bacterium]